MSDIFEQTVDSPNRKKKFVSNIGTVSHYVFISRNSVLRITLAFFSFSQ